MNKSLYDLYMDYANASYNNWISKELFSFGWIFNICFLIIFYIIWIILIDKKRLKELLLFGALISVVASFIDIVAVSLGLWEYKTRLFPINPATFPFDYTVLPILYIFVMQYSSSWKSYLIGSVIACSIFSFIISPIYVWLGIKIYHNFNYFYMFVLVFTVTTFIKAIFNWIDNIQEKSLGKKT